HDADCAAQQRGPVPFQRRLGRPHPRGPPAGQHHTRRTSHSLMLGGRTAGIPSKVRGSHPPVLTAVATVLRADLAAASVVRKVTAAAEAMISPMARSALANG